MLWDYECVVLWYFQIFDTSLKCRKPWPWHFGGILLVEILQIFFNFRSTLPSFFLHQILCLFPKFKHFYGSLTFRWHASTDFPYSHFSLTLCHFLFLNSVRKFHVYMETLRCDDVAKHGSPVRLNWKLTKLVPLTKMGKSVSGEPTCSKNNQDASRT